MDILSGPRFGSPLIHETVSNAVTTLHKRTDLRTRLVGFISSVLGRHHHGLVPVATVSGALAAAQVVGGLLLQLQLLLLPD